MVATGSVILSADLSEFFRGEVTGARDSLGLELSDFAEYYLVNLLCEFSSRRETLTPGEEPLALLYKRALEASDAERIQLLKNLGDVSLYMAGFFADFVERSLVSLNYYISMGGNAYSRLSSMLSTKRHGQTFAELSRKFTQVVDVLTEIADRSRAQASRDADIVKMYDRWTRTGSDRIHHMLLEKGLVFGASEPTEFLQ
ncbi:MAG: hypothetical protein R3C68_03815 [Myxococcota bacterium]